MGLKLAQDKGRYSELLRKADTLFDCDILKVMTEGPPEKLSETMMTQPAMLIDGYVS